MKGYLGNIASRAVGRAPLVQPRQPSIFEPDPYLDPPGDAAMVQDDGGWQADATMHDQPQTVAPATGPRTAPPSAATLPPTQPVETAGAPPPAIIPAPAPQPVAPAVQRRAHVGDNSPSLRLAETPAAAAPPLLGIKPGPAQPEAFGVADNRPATSPPDVTEADLATLGEPRPAPDNVIRAVTPTGRVPGMQVWQPAAPIQPSVEGLKPLATSVRDMPPADQQSGTHLPTVELPEPVAHRQTSDEPRQGRNAPPQSDVPVPLGERRVLAHPERQAVSAMLPPIAAQAHVASQGAAAPIEVHIGKIEIVGNSPPPPPRRAAAAPSRTLDSFLAGTRR